MQINCHGFQFLPVQIEHSQPKLSEELSPLRTKCISLTFMFVTCHITHLTHLHHQLKFTDIVVNLDKFECFHIYWDR
jgi:hypothetical protein